MLYFLFGCNSILPSRTHSIQCINTRHMSTALLLISLNNLHFLCFSLNYFGVYLKIDLKLQMKLTFIYSKKLLFYLLSWNQSR